MSSDMTRDIVITAVEGSINYWAEVENYKPEDDYASAYITDYESGITYFLDNHTVADALSDIAKSGWNDVNEEIMKSILYMHHTGKIDNRFDAEVADVIIQKALLGDVIYG